MQHQVPKPRSGYESASVAYIMRPLMISAIDPGTLQAYRETDYRVLEGLPATLHVDAVCPELGLLHARDQPNCAAFITAHNPLGRRAAAPRNAQRQQALLAELTRRKLVAIP